MTDIDPMIIASCTLGLIVITVSVAYFSGACTSQRKAERFGTQSKRPTSELVERAKAGAHDSRGRYMVSSPQVSRGLATGQGGSKRGDPELGYQQRRLEVLSKVSRVDNNSPAAYGRKASSVAIAVHLPEETDAPTELILHKGELIDSRDAPRTTFIEPYNDNAGGKGAGKLGVDTTAKASDTEENVLAGHALYDFAAGTEAELNLSAGERVIVLQSGSDGWMRARNMAGKEGLVPSSYVEVPDPVKGLSGDGGKDSRSSSGESFEKVEREAPETKSPVVPKHHSTARAHQEALEFRAHEKKVAAETAKEVAAETAKEVAAETAKEVAAEEARDAEQQQKQQQEEEEEQKRLSKMAQWQADLAKAKAKKQEEAEKEEGVRGDEGGSAKKGNQPAASASDNTAAGEPESPKPEKKMTHAERKKAKRARAKARKRAAKGTK